MISKSLTNRIFASIQQFSIQKYSQPLGVGSFGTVRLGIHKYTNKSYAIKIICVDKDFKQNQLCLLERQISIHYNLNHPHIIKLWDVIEQTERIYLIMQYAHKGNLFNFQSQYKAFTQVQAFKIFIQTVDAIDYLHKNNIFHRDIKPQNILLDHQMNTKLCDFGWAAPDITRKRSTFCGTYEYMAPQMIHQEEYDFRIDIWALGVLLYELIHSSAPFPAQTFEQMKIKISSGSYEINANISSQLKNLIMSILQFDCNDRPSIHQIKTNLWMQKMKKSIQNKNTELKFDKKKTKNVYGSLDFTPSKYQSSKFGSLLFQDATNKKEIKNIDKQTKKKLKKKCKTLQQQSIQKLTRPLKNMLTLYTQKQNDDKDENIYNGLKIRQKYKMLSKITLTKNQLVSQKQSCTKLNLNRLNNYMNTQGQSTELKNFKSEQKIDKNGGLTNRNLQTADVKKKKKKAI